MTQVGLAAVFGVALAAIAVLVWAGNRTARKGVAERLRKQFPESPWKWNPDWSHGRVASSDRRNLIFSWGFAVVWSALSTPVTLLLPAEVLQKQNYPALLGVLFPLVAVWLVGHAAYKTLQWRRYGDSELELVTFPGEVGGSFRGSLRLPMREIPADGLHVDLTATKRWKTEPNSSAREKLLWHEERLLPSTSLSPTSSGLAAEVEFAIPSDAEPSTAKTDGATITWKLSTKASVPGIDYRAEFDVPVFHVDDPQPPRASFAPSQSQFDPRESTIRVEPSPAGGTRFVFPAGRNPGAGVGLTVFTAIWWGVIALMHYLGFGIVFEVLFGLFGVLLAWASLDQWFGRSVVVVEDQKIGIRHSLLWPGKTRELTASQVEKIGISMGMKQNESMTQSARAWYDVELHQKSGKDITLGRHVGNKREAEWLAERISTALMLRE